MRQTLCIIVLFAVVASTLSHQTPQNAISKKCKTKYNVSEDFLNDLHANPEQLFENPKMRCFAACILIENKTLKSDGSLDAATLIETMPQNIFEREKVVEAFNACANEKGADPCETAYKTVVCMNSKEAIRTIRPSE